MSEFNYYVEQQKRCLEQQMGQKAVGSTFASLVKEGIIDEKGYYLWPLNGQKAEALNFNVNLNKSSFGKGVIVACDFDSEFSLENFLNQMDDLYPNFYCKIGSELFFAGVLALRSFNPIKIIKSRNHKVFLDLKLKDDTLVKTIKTLINADVDMISVQADMGLKMMKAAAESVNEIYLEYQEKYNKIKNDGSYSAENLAYLLKKKLANKLLLIGNTVLNSMNEEDFREVDEEKISLEQVVSLAKLYKEAGFAGVICLPQESLAVKEACGNDFITINPGIRLADSKKDDQTKVATPACANLMGSDYIVVGSSITKALNPMAAYTRCVKDFTEEVTDPAEIEAAKLYLASLTQRRIRKMK